MQTWLAAGVAVLSVTGTPAADDIVPPKRRIEEIVVTAQKAEESLADVPISLTVADDDFLAEHAITDYRELGLFVPNAHFDLGGGVLFDVSIRGFGSPLPNKGFEQSVGLAIDGIPYGRAPFFVGPLFDVERVEVLRGPQGILFGRNTTAGLLNVITKKPTGELSADVLVDAGELSRHRVEAGVGGPIAAGRLEARVALLYDQRDGIVENTSDAVFPDANERMSARDRKGVRLLLQAPDVLGTSFLLGYERVDFDLDGLGWEFDRVPERMRPFFRQFDPDTDFDKFNLVGSIDAPEVNHNRLQTVAAHAHRDLADWGLDAVAGWSLIEIRHVVDNDLTPAPTILTTNSDRSPQWTAEVRATSPELRT